mmetsp:Transcript_20694/g.40968  ORF Transcript_20694/g.40968 Transcript_20694/m.40968 type:complete len:357 (+) Transcript_20694:174-1244(+)
MAGAKHSRNGKMALRFRLGQRGAPKEEDLINWAHHATPLTVPDLMFRQSHSAAGGEIQEPAAAKHYVSFVFSAEVDGRPISAPSEAAEKALSCRVPDPPEETGGDKSKKIQIITAEEAQLKRDKMLEDEQRRKRTRAGHSSGSDSDLDNEEVVVERRSGRTRKPPNRLSDSIGQGLDDVDKALARSLLEADMQASAQSRTRASARRNSPAKRNAKAKVGSESEKEEEEEEEEGVSSGDAESTDKSSSDDEEQEQQSKSKSKSKKAKAINIISSDDDNDDDDDAQDAGSGSDSKDNGNDDEEEEEEEEQEEQRREMMRPQAEIATQKTSLLIPSSHLLALWQGQSTAETGKWLCGSA